MQSNLKKFLIKTLIYISPFIIILLLLVLIDPFKIWFNYEEYYKNNFVSTNRGVVTLRLFERNRNNITYNSFIFGSSRSQAFKVSEWKKYLNEKDNGFHFDSSGEGIYGIYNKLKYISDKKIKISNALIIVDYKTLNKTENMKGYLYISPPELTGESKYSFYKEFIMASFDRNFIIGYIDFKLFHKYRKYMYTLFNNKKYDYISDNITGDIYYGADKMIEEDSNGYYNNLISKGVFYDRNKRSFENEAPITDLEKKFIVKISQILKKENTKYKIVISPLYDQQKLSVERVNMLKDIFGEENIYDFSGKNKLTESVYNYYEDSHFRPHIANEIMDTIYKNDFNIAEK